MRASSLVRAPRATVACMCVVATISCSTGAIASSIAHSGIGRCLCTSSHEALTRGTPPHALPGLRCQLSVPSEYLGDDATSSSRGCRSWHAASCHAIIMSLESQVDHLGLVMPLRSQLWQCANREGLDGLSSCATLLLAGKTKIECEKLTYLEGSATRVAPSSQGLENGRGTWEPCVSDFSGVSLRRKIQIPA